MSDQLLPCPFCGGPAKHCVGIIKHRIVCVICRAIGPLRYLKSQAIIAWNRRAPMDPERTEFARILAGLKSRGVITQADIDRVSLPSSVLCPPSSPSPEAPHA